ncbi:MAG: FAD-dependent monooxygenase [Cyclobacteriaceae bacterium]|nr:FAD-dependent monooxygenase [Cyclobacteriaceae bacterium]
MKNFAILGGGIGGLSLAIALQKKGLQVTVYESAPVYKPLGAGLGLAANAVKAYQEIGISDRVVEAGKKLKHAFGKEPDGKIISQTDIEAMTDRFGVLNSFTIHRADLHEVLFGLLNPGTVINGKSAVGVSQDSEGVSVSFSDGTSAKADYLIAADGVHSVVRQSLLPGSAPRYAGYTCWRAVTDGLPEGMNPDEMSETWGRGRRFGVVPLTGNRVYWFATLNAPPNDPAMRAARRNELRQFFDGFHFPIPQLLDMTRDDQIIWNDIIDLKPINRFAFGRMVLIGDAAHATTPNLGQGACMAIEDAATLANALEDYEPEIAFRKFESFRIRRTTQIVNQSWNLGRIAQLENPLLMRLRNGIFRLLPESMIHAQLRDLYTVSFRP